MWYSVGSGLGKAPNGQDCTFPRRFRSAVGTASLDVSRPYCVGISAEGEVGGLGGGKQP